MERSLFPDGCLVDTEALSYTESTKAEEILLDRKDNWETGINSGWVLTVNSVNLTRIDLSSGDGYDVSGDHIVTPTSQLNISLSDSSQGALNYVYLFYVELQQDPEPHETNGTVQNTTVTIGYVLGVYTADQFASLPSTDPTFATNAQDRSVLIGIVTATGGNLTNANIQQPAPWRGLQYAVMAQPPLLGVDIVAVSDNTPEGQNGVISFTTGPNALTWQAPGESGPGASVSIPNEAVYTLVALGGSSIQVDVVPSALPASAGSIQITITGVYEQPVPRMSSTDRHHRSLVGTGVPTPQNPHGLSIADIEPGFLSEIDYHQELMHAAGIWRGSSPACLEATIVDIPGVDYLLITAPTGVDTYWVQGQRFGTILNTTVTFNDSLPTAAKELYEIYVTDSTNILRNKRAAFPVSPNIFGAENLLVYLSPNIPAGSYNLNWTVLSGSAGYTLSWNGGVPTFVPFGTTSGLFTLYSGNNQEVQFFISAISDMPTTVGSYTDSITVNATINLEEFIVICQVAWTGTLTSKLGYTPNRGVIDAKLVDSRLFGTLTAFDIRDDTLQQTLQQPLFDHCNDGVVVDFPGLLKVATSSGLAVNIGSTGISTSVYVRGQLFRVTGTTNFTVTANDLTVIYVDVDGNINSCNIVYAAFLNKGNNIRFLPQDIQVEYGSALALVITNSSAVTEIIDLRRNIGGGNVSVQPWSVGSDDIIGLWNQGCQFFDLIGALYYAVPGEVVDFTLMNTLLSNPCVLPASPCRITGGVLRFADSALATNSALTTTSGASALLSGTELYLTDVTFVANNPSSTATFAIVTANAWTSVDMVGCVNKCAGSLVTTVDVAAANVLHVFIQDLDTATTGFFGPLVNANFDVDIRINNFTYANAINFLSTNSIVNVATGINLIACRLNNGFTPHVFSWLQGAGTLTEGSFVGLYGFGLQSFTGSFGDCEFLGCGFNNNNASTVILNNSSNNDLRFVDCFITAGNIRLSSSNMWMNNCVISGDLFLDNTISGVSIVNCQLGGLNTTGSGTWSNVDISNCQISSTGGVDIAANVMEFSFSGNDVTYGFIVSGTAAGVWVENNFLGANVSFSDGLNDARIVGNQIQGNLAVSGGSPVRVDIQGNRIVGAFTGAFHQFLNFSNNICASTISLTDLSGFTVFTANQVQGNCQLGGSGDSLNNCYLSNNQFSGNLLMPGSLTKVWIDNCDIASVCTLSSGAVDLLWITNSHIVGALSCTANIQGIWISNSECEDGITLGTGSGSDFVSFVNITNVECGNNIVVPARIFQITLRDVDFVNVNAALIQLLGSDMQDISIDNCNPQTIQINSAGSAITTFDVTITNCVIPVNSTSANGITMNNVFRVWIRGCDINTETTPMFFENSAHLFISENMFSQVHLGIAPIWFQDTNKIYFKGNQIDVNTNDGTSQPDVATIVLFTFVSGPPVTGTFSSIFSENQILVTDTTTPEDPIMFVAMVPGGGVLCNMQVNHNVFHDPANLEGSTWNAQWWGNVNAGSFPGATGPVVNSAFRICALGVFNQWPNPNSAYTGRPSLFHVVGNQFIPSYTFDIGLYVAMIHDGQEHGTGAVYKLCSQNTIGYYNGTGLTTEAAVQAPVLVQEIFVAQGNTGFSTDQWNM